MLQIPDVSSLTYCTADGSCPGVYENALGDLDSTPHTWAEPYMVDPNGTDAPFSSYAAMPEGTSSLTYCNATDTCPGLHQPHTLNKPSTAALSYRPILNF